MLTQMQRSARLDYGKMPAQFGIKEGPIAERWNVTAWPTIFVLDERDVKRNKGLRDEYLRNALDELLSGKAK
jgi:hypothetical protein